MGDAILTIGPGGFGWKKAYYDNNAGTFDVEIKRRRAADTLSGMSVTNAAPAPQLVRSSGSFSPTLV